MLGRQSNLGTQSRDYRIYQMTFRAATRFALTALGIVATLLAAVICNELIPVVSRTTYERIPAGAPPALVREIVGEPNRIVQHRDGVIEWEYTRAFTAGWIEIWFDSSGAFNYVNDESCLVRW